MNLLDSTNIYDKQKFEWGEISWMHEPIDSPYGRLSVAQVKIYPGCQQEKHFHLGEEQLFYVVQGQGSFITNGKKEDVYKPMIVYIPPHSEHEVFNTGKEDLIFVVVYVPIKLIQLQKPYTVAAYKNIQDLIPLEILQNIKEQLSELLKLIIHIYDGNHQLLTQDNEENEFCKICSSMHPCNKRKYTSDSSNLLSDNMYKCDYDLIELEVPITLNDNILGYIKSGSFVLSNSEEIDKKIDAIQERLGIDRDPIWTIYKKIPDIIKSRIYVIQEHLVIAAQFTQVMLERSVFEQELTEKDNEILMSTKEKIQLKDALKKANHKIYHDKIFAGGANITKEFVYPYDVEIILENAIKELDLEKIEKSIDDCRNKYIDSENIVQEMIVVLSRTAMRSLENIEIISQMRKKYDKHLQQIKKEDPWEILKCFCMDCIEEYKKIRQSNRRELIDNINMYINTHYKEDLSLNLIAEIFYISPNYLSSLFNEKNRISFSDYVQNLRIEEAKKYLRSTPIKVCDIAKKVGFKNNSYFVNVFKKNVGMTPNEYRKNPIG
ncbi:helix-turn-helix domain-containing protein [Geosporobacter ferrireducens]|uniref:helix-turn-helix domain-containing protein n=1 Tax=Geosporobacter ferrireducens TaxID=1424294 RepID=UPI00139BD231|nr:helix-turn-helix domain-containing protein [Geosporobacter ferrireducens]MTI57459.1 helix-turn-helix domain-containing protein [Geosporobacter ferrireducens]